MPQLASLSPSKLSERSGIALSLPSGIAILSVHTCPVARLGGKKTGGMNVYIRDLARDLGARGIKVDVFTRCEAKVAPEVKRLSPNAQVIHVASGPPKTLDPYSIYPHLNEFTDNVFKYVKRAKQNTALPYQLIHANYWLSGLVGLRLRDQWHIPLLTTFHTLGHVKNHFLSLLSLPQPNPSLTYPGSIYQPKHILKEPQIRLNAEAKLVRTSDHLLAFTPDEQDHLVNLYTAKPTKITLIPPGVDLNRFHPYPQSVSQNKLGLPKNQQLLLFVGRLDPIKGIETLLSAITHLKRCPPFCVAIIGGEHDDQYFDQIKSLAQKLGIGTTTTFLGSQDQRLLPYYYSAAAMTIIPSSHESFSLVALESMACGTPVVASRVGGLKYLVKDRATGILVPAEEPKPLAQAIQTLLTNPTLREKMGFLAQKHAQHYSWTHITPKILTLYQSLI